MLILKYCRCVILLSYSCVFEKRVGKDPDDGNACFNGVFFFFLHRSLERALKMSLG